MQTSAGCARSANPGAGFRRAILIINCLCILVCQCKEHARELYFKFLASHSPYVTRINISICEFSCQVCNAFIRRLRSYTSILFFPCAFIKTQPASLKRTLPNFYRTLHLTMNTHSSFVYQLHVNRITNQKAKASALGNRFPVAKFYLRV